MATQTVEFAAASGLTLTVKLFAAGSDTVVASVSATEATNRLGLYSAAYTDVAAGTYKMIALSGTTPVATWWADLTLTTATFQSYEIPVSVIQSGLALETSVQSTLDRLGFTLAALAGNCADPQTAAETYSIILGANTFTIDHTGLDATGTRTTATLTKS